MPSQAESLEALRLAVDAGLNPVLVGKPGVGKTAAIKALGAEMDADVITVILSIRDQTDVGGLPVVTDDGVRLEPPVWAKRAVKNSKEGRRTIVLFDEANTAVPAVQAAMLTVVFGHQVGDLVLPDDVRFVLAMNAADEAADGHDLAAPLANRLTFIPWEHDVAAWSAGILTGFGSTEPADSHTALARARVAGFIHARPNLLHKMPDDDAGRGGAWPSPRSWDLASRLIASSWRGGKSATALNLALVGTIGEGAAHEFITWLDDQDLPDPEDVLADPDAYELPERGDRAFSVLTSVAAAVLANNTAERWEQSWKVLAKSVDAGLADIGTIAAQALASNRPAKAKAPQVITAFAPLLEAMGAGSSRK